MNKDQIKQLLLSSDRAVERAMVALFNLQTEGERATNSTSALNNKGFNAFHANTGSYYAKWILSGRKLTGNHLAKARKMACHYARQLADISEARLFANTETYMVRDMTAAMAVYDPFQ